MYKHAHVWGGGLLTPQVGGPSSIRSTSLKPAETGPPCEWHGSASLGQHLEALDKPAYGYVEQVIGTNPTFIPGLISVSSIFLRHVRSLGVCVFLPSLLICVSPCSLEI